MNGEAVELWLDGKLICPDLHDMRLLDFGDWISVEGGFVFEKLPGHIRSDLKALGLDLD
jgi:hypothetical protein